ncbi:MULTISPECIES: MvaI/BcnI family restriction endonuclease [unclassified Petrotoga]|uniref:MvaI/BcnI family restriction endonuclease n=1 Tax=unclassified Petrotoga TaxID=2620614 RepID=UPI000CA01C52|nr:MULTISPECIES: MvaI/BcnI family restriction endonuclease [unclassified Petrotoga]PNR91851.1 hypothetical protein X926_08000 [Petrotoga sp. HWHPT.55.6.3]
MTQTELKKKLDDIKNMGYVPSLRKGPTGIGFTLESLLGLTETNIPVPDLGGRIEIKAARRDSNSLITLFTFNRGVWQIRTIDFIEQYGYIDKNGRKSIYCTVSSDSYNNQGLIIKVRKDNQSLELLDKRNKLLALWSIYSLVGKFLNKLGMVLFVLADTKKVDKIEQFHFNEAYMLYNPLTDNFIDALEKSIVKIDFRMHIKENNTIRNHGTGIRIKEIDLPLLYGNKKQLI